MSADLTPRELDQLETIDPDALSDSQSAALAHAQSVC